MNGNLQTSLSGSVEVRVKMPENSRVILKHPLRFCYFFRGIVNFTGGVMP